MITEKDYCDYDTCVALKELGYKGISRFFYATKESPLRRYSHDQILTTRIADSVGHTLAISLYVAQKWLREERGVIVEVFVDDDSDTPITYNIYKDGKCIVHHHGNYYSVNDWNIALLEGIKEAVKILKEENNMKPTIQELIQLYNNAESRIEKANLWSHIEEWAEIFAENKYPNESDEIKIKSSVFGIPNDLVEKALSLRKVKHYFGGKPKHVKYSNEEYDLILLGCALAYHSQTLLGRKLPLDHPKSVEVCRILQNIGVSIQYHPEHGMILVDKQDSNGN